MSEAACAPFPLDGGRAGDGGAPATPDAWTHAAHAPGAVTRARRLRQAMSVGEKALWRELRKRGLHVRRQAPIGRYVADFAIHGAKLIIEVDGPHHEGSDQVARDLRRDAWLRSQGYRVLRFTISQAPADPGRLAGEISDVAGAPPSPTLPPSRGKGG